MDIMSYPITRFIGRGIVNPIEEQPHTCQVILDEEFRRDNHVSNWFLSVHRGPGNKMFSVPEHFLNRAVNIYYVRGSNFGTIEVKLIED